MREEYCERGKKEKKKKEGQEGADAALGSPSILYSSASTASNRCPKKEKETNGTDKRNISRPFFFSSPSPLSWRTEAHLDARLVCWLRLFQVAQLAGIQ